MIKVFNTMSKKIEELKPNQENKIKMFVCGPTVYDFMHVGHAKSYISYDVIVKYLKYRGFEVNYIQNITDIDDKIIQRSNEQGISWKELSEKYTKAYFEDMKALNVTAVNNYYKATDYVNEIIEQARVLIEKGFAYESAGNVYYSISKFKDYGKLSHREPDEMLAMSRLDEDPYKKEPFDFVIWKNSKPGEPTWDSPWGKGRPGWHIEDTAISITNFGSQYDIHGGGVDLIFPHHEAEIAIAEAYTGIKPFVKYWVHNSFITVNGKKMSKSLNNYVTIKEAIKKHGAEALRYYFATTLYNKQVDYTNKSIEDAKKELERIKNAVSNLLFYKSKKVFGEHEIEVEKFKNKFIEVMDNNFNTASGIAVVFELIKEVNSHLSELTEKSVIDIINFLKEVQEIFGVAFVITEQKINVPEQVQKLVEEREQARKNKDWVKADELRDKIKELGFKVIDTKEGVKIEKIN